MRPARETLTVGRTRLVFEELPFHDNPPRLVVTGIAAKMLASAMLAKDYVWVRMRRYAITGGNVPEAGPATFYLKHNP
jgi:hypothetical protein